MNNIKTIYDLGPQQISIIQTKGHRRYNEKLQLSKKSLPNGQKLSG